MVEPPCWLTEFANAVIKHIVSYDVIPPLGCHFHELNNEWEVTVFASRTEIIGGSKDGQTTSARFYVDIHALLLLFSRIDGICWQSHPIDGHDEIGAHLAINGTFDKYQVHLRIPAIAPERFQSGRRALVNRRDFEEVW